MDVFLLIFGKKSFSPSIGLLGDIKKFIEGNYEYNINPKYKGLLGKLDAFTDKNEAERNGKWELASTGGYIKLADVLYPHQVVYGSDPGIVEAYYAKIKRLREELGEKLDDSFSVALSEFIKAKGRTDVEVYKRANIDRRLFSKIRNDFYTPGKRTTIALAVALELTLDETNELLKHSGYTLSRSLIFDVVVTYFISQGKYDIYEINNVLFSYDQPILGG